jgi:hypothetical protein
VLLPPPLELLRIRHARPLALKVHTP